MLNEMVMRSVYLRPEEDGQLRQLAFALGVTKSDLIRSAIAVKLGEWLGTGGRAVATKDLELGRRLSHAERAAKAAGATLRSAPGKTGVKAVKPPEAVEATLASAEPKARARPTETAVKKPVDQSSLKPLARQSRPKAVVHSEHRLAAE